jgi:hypothetical protein
MKKTITLILAGAIALVSTNCTTTYDSYGNPRQSVDPGTAVAGAAAAGVLGYAIANNRDNDNNHYYNNRRVYGRNYYGRSRRY